MKVMDIPAYLCKIDRTVCMLQANVINLGG